MELKTWILGKVQRLNGLLARDDLPPHEAGDSGPALRSSDFGRESVSASAHLGAYAPLIDAIREELEQFVAAQLRLHLSIAENDRFLLTAIELAAPDAGEGLQLLKRFNREFRPEQIRRYLEREVIGALPNAAAMDLSQFAGLAFKASDAVPAAAPAGEYDELLQALRDEAPLSGGAVYEVRLAGRWTEGPAPRFAALAAGGRAAPQTPLAGTPLVLEVEDAQGPRRVSLPPALPGRRHVVGKGEGCDIVLNGTYASRRHCEIWLEDGAWRVLDTGSTNGIRVEQGGQVQRSSAGRPPEPIVLRPGARVVLSAVAEGEARDHPWFRLPSLDTPKTPLAGTAATPVTPIAGARPHAATLTLTAKMAADVRSVELTPQRLPLGMGRSRREALVIDGVHAGVSGHHLEIVALGDAAVEVLVHGDNGVSVDGHSHGPGARFTWPLGQTLALGTASPEEPVCTLSLSRSH